MLFPNPTTGSSVLSLNVSVDQLVSITVLDANGRITQLKQVMMRRGYNKQLIDLSLMTNGTYEVQIKSVDWNKVFKLIKN
jgi:hypothetical protein